MKRLWNAINETKISKATKNKLYLGVLIAINVLIGGGAWLLLGRLVLPGIDWLLCLWGIRQFLLDSLVGYFIYTIMSLHNFYRSFT